MVRVDNVPHPQQPLFCNLISFVRHNNDKFMQIHRRIKASAETITESIFKLRSFQKKQAEVFAAVFILPRYSFQPEHTRIE